MNDQTMRPRAAYFFAEHGASVRAAMGLSESQFEQTLLDYIDSRCEVCGIAGATGDAGELRVCGLCIDGAP